MVQLVFFYPIDVSDTYRRVILRTRRVELSLGGPEKGRLISKVKVIYLEAVYLVTALVPSETACLASSPGRRSLTAV